MSGGGGSQTTTSSSTVPPQFLNAYQNTVNRATNVAQTPYQGYGGSLVAGFSGDQSQAQQQVRNLQGGYQPYLNAASGNINASTQPLWSGVAQSGVSQSAGINGYNPNFWGNTAQTGLSGGVSGYASGIANSGAGINAASISQYENPYQSQVINAAEGQIANTDAQQQAQLGGNAASAGAFGGDRMGVAQGVLGGQQAIANNSTLAGLNQANYSQALGEANQQQGVALNEFNQQQAAQLGANEAGQQMANSEFNTQQQSQLGANEANSWLNSQAGYANANLANESNSLGLSNASALSQSGLTQQQQDQAGLNTAYEQWQAKQAFPYQQTGWLANITEGIGSNVGGNSTSSTTQNKDGGRIARAGGGIVPGFDSGGAMGYGSAPYGYGGQGSILSDIPNVGTSYIPGSGGGTGGGGGIGRGPPAANAPPMQQGSSIGSDISAASGAASLYKNLGLGGMFGSGAGSAVGAGTEYAGAAAGAAPLTAVSSAPLAALGSSAGAAGAGAGGAGFLGSLGSAVEAGAADVGSAVASGAGALGGALSGAAAGIGSGLAAGASAIGGGLDWLISLLALKDGGAVEAPKDHPGYGGGIVVPFPHDRVRRASGGGIGGMMPYSDAPPVQANGTTGMSYMDGITGTPGAMGPGAARMGASAPPSGSSSSGGILGSFQQNGGFGVLPSLLPNLFAAGGSIDGRAFGGGVNSAWGGGGSGILGRGGPPDLNASSAGVSPFGEGPIGSASNLNAPHGMMLRRGGIVPRFADGGSPATDDTWSGAGDTSTGSADSWSNPSSDQSSAPSSSAPASSFTAEKPNLWLPALAGIATAVVGHHANAGRNIAEGVLAGLNTYGSEDQRYQQGREKSASLDQEAKKLADDAQFHRENIANENLRTQQQGQYQQGMLANDQARTDQQAKYQAGELGLRGQEVSQQGAYQQGELGIRGQEAGTQAKAEQSLEAYRAAVSGRGKFSVIGTDPSGNPVFGDGYSGTMQDAQGNPYTGAVRPTAVQQGRLDNQQQANQARIAAMNLAHTDREKALAEHGDASTLYAAGNLVRADMNGKTTLEQAYAQAARYHPGGQPAPTAAPQQQAVQPAAAPAAPSGPQVGMVQSGYRFMGGDPSSQQNWQKVQ